MSYLDPIKNREKGLLRTWMLLKSKGETNQLDHLKVQSSLSYTVLVILCGLTAWSIYDYGLLSFTSGVFIGGFAGVLGSLKRSQRDWNVMKKYLNWDAVEKEDAKQNT